MSASRSGPAMSIPEIRPKGFPSTLPAGISLDRTRTGNNPFASSQAGSRTASSNGSFLRQQPVSIASADTNPTSMSIGSASDEGAVNTPPLKARRTPARAVAGRRISNSTPRHHTSQYASSNSARRGRNVEADERMSSQLNRDDLPPFQELDRAFERLPTPRLTPDYQVFANYVDSAGRRLDIPKPLADATEEFLLSESAKPRNRSPNARNGHRKFASDTSSTNQVYYTPGDASQRYIPRVPSPRYTSSGYYATTPEPPRTRRRPLVMPKDFNLDAQQNKDFLSQSPLLAERLGSSDIHHKKETENSFPNSLENSWSKINAKSAAKSLKAQLVINSTISKDNTKGDCVRNARLLSEFARKIKRAGHRGPGKPSMTSQNGNFDDLRDTAVPVNPTTTYHMAGMGEAFNPDLADYLRDGEAPIPESGLSSDLDYAESLSDNSERFTRVDSLQRHSSVGGVAYRTRDESLPPIIVDDPNDLVAIKRARNILAARKSRQRKAQRFDELEDEISRLETERNHWKDAVLKQSNMGSDNINVGSGNITVHKNVNFGKAFRSEDVTYSVPRRSSSPKYMVENGRAVPIRSQVHERPPRSAIY